MNDKQLPFSLEAAEKLLQKNGLEKIFNVEYVGKDRKARVDKSHISEMRWFIKLCSEYGIPRSVILKSIQNFDDRFKDSNLAAFNLYCSRMFKLTPVDAKDNGIDMDQTEKMDNDAQGMKLQSLLIFLFVLAIPFVSVYAQEQEGACANRPCELTDMPGGQGGSTHVMCETIEGIAGANRESRPLFMRDDWYMKGGFDVDTIGEVKKNDGNDNFKYREWILNNSYNIVKGKVLSAQIGKDNNGTIADLTQMRFNTVKASVFNLKKVIENEKAFNKIRNIQLKHDIAKGMM